MTERQLRAAVAEKLSGLCGESTEGGDNVLVLAELVELEVERLQEKIRQLRKAIGPALAILEADHIPPKPGQAYEVAGRVCPVCELRRVYGARA